jgi:tetratricopeptide (TPR) repeat protein
MERGMDPQLSLWKWPVLLGGLIIIGLVFLLFYLYRKNSNSLSPKPSTLNPFSVWFFGIGWFFVALAPVSGITPINALIYEHWLYLPMVGFWFIAAFYLDKILDFFKNKNSIFYFLLSIFLVGYSVFFAAQAIKRNILWGKPIPFYEDILKYEPDSVRINNNLGNVYYNEGNVAKAEEFYGKAVAGEDVFPQPYFNLGSILQSRSDIFGAIQEYKKAIEVDPNFYYAYQNLASIYAQQGDLSNAALMLEKARELRPQDPRIYYNLGLVYFAQGKKELALDNLNSALKYSASDLQTSAEVKKLLEKLGK